MGHKANIVGVALLFVACGSEALTLGRLRGAALIGHSLDVSVQVQMEAGEDASTLCFDAEVFHADARQDPNRVRVTVDAPSSTHAANVRILSSAIVDEPVVTVNLRTGCGQKTSRRYVLLADMPNDVAQPMSGSVFVPVATTSPVVSNSTSSSSTSWPPVTSRSVAPAKAKKDRVKTPPLVKGAVDAALPSHSTEKNKASRPAGQSRLKLDPLDVLSDRIANLDSYMTFAPTQDALQGLQKVQTLEGDVKALRALAAKNEASLADLKDRLQKAELERFPAGLVYGLIAIVLACLAAVAWVWSRQRRAQGGEWWSGAIATPDSAHPGHASFLDSQAAPQDMNDRHVPQKADTAVLSGLMDPDTSSEVGVNLMDMSESAFDDLMQTGDESASSLKSSALVLPVEAAPPTVHALSSEATLDIRQQAEFYVSLGQSERAVRILKKEIEDSEAPNPYLYLDLLSLFHSLGLKHDFKLLREDFNLLFNGRVPEFAFFKEEGQGLMDYPDVLSRITALWSTPQVTNAIEAYINMDPRMGMSQSFDLAAFRDLLLLHAVAHSLYPAQPADAGNFAARAHADVQDAHSLDLDLDLSDLALPEDIDIPLVMHDERKAAAQQAEDDRQLLNLDDLMKFDLPKASK